MSRIKNLIPLLSLLFVLPVSSFAANQWTYTELGNSAGFSRVEFVTANTIVAATSGSALNSGVLYVTTDAGATWTKKVENVAIINSITFVNSMTGFAAGGASGYGDAAYFGKTTDGGDTWADLTEAFRKSTGSTTVIPLYGLAAVDGNTLYAVGYWSLYRSLDGGTSWEELIQFYKDDPLSETSYLHHSTLQFVGGRGFIASQQHLFRTDTGGSWEKITTVPWDSKNDDRELKTLAFLTAESGWALVVDNYISSSSPGTGAWLYRTSDGGATWGQVYSWDDSSVYEYPTVLYASDTNELWVGGWEEIWHSTDGGVNFILENEGSLARRVWRFQRFGTEAAPRAIASSGISGTSIYGYYIYTGGSSEATTTTTTIPDATTTTTTMPDATTTTTTIPPDTSTTTTSSGGTCPAEVSLSDSRDLALLRAFRDKISMRDDGKRIVALYYRNAREAADIISAHETLRARCGRVIVGNMGTVANMLATGRGVISAASLAEIKKLLRDLQLYASRGFADDIDAVIEAVEHENLPGRLGIAVREKMPTTAPGC